MKRKNMLKAVIAIAVAMAFVMPVAAVANNDMDNIATNIQKSIENIVTYRRDNTPILLTEMQTPVYSSPDLEYTETIFTEGFEDTWVADSDGDLAPPGWENHITNPGDTGSPYYLPWHWGQYGVVSSYAPPAVPPEGDYQAIVHWSYNHQDEWLVTPEINLSEYTNVNLMFMRYGHTGSTYGDHYYVKVSPSGGYGQENFTDILWDATALPPGDNYYEYPYIIDLSAYDGTTIRIAWHNEDPPTNDGLWYGSCIDDVVVCTPPDHDVGITIIDSPVNGPAGVITPEVTVENFGTSNEIDVPVNMKISEITAPTIVLDEGFEEYTAEIDVFPPPGWTIENISVSTWYKYQPTTSKRARCWESGAGGLAQDEWLITDTLDCSGSSNLWIEFYRYMSISSSTGDSYCDVLGSIDNGATWPYTIKSYVSTVGLKTEGFDISSWADGESEVKIAWRFVSTADSGMSDHFYFDDLWIGSVVTAASEDFDSGWGPYGDVPPENWTIEDYGTEDPPAWNDNDWHYYSSDDCARVYYIPSEDQDERLISLPIDCSGLTDMALTFWNYCYPSSYKTGYVEGSIDNGTTWPYLIDSYTSSIYGIVETYDISSWADNEPEVKIRFRWAGAYGYSYWKVDDFWVGSKAPLITATFDDVIPDDWGPNGWSQEDVINMETGTDPNIWICADDTYYTTPTNVDPYAGDYMAIYDTGKLYPEGSKARLYTSALDFSSYGFDIFNLKFMMYISDYNSANTDRLVVQASTDGTTWDDIVTIGTYDATDPGWVQQMVDLSAYKDETTVYLGFLGVDGGYSDIIIDEVRIEIPGVVLEYDVTVYVDIDSGEIVTVTFPDWTPADWQVSESTSIEYYVEAKTLLATDEVPDNDGMSGYITLDYPYLHDIAVISINDPTSGTAQKDLPVEVTIKNIGQFTECCYTTDVQIGGWIPTGPPTEITYDFESNDGGFVPTATWDPIGDWEWTDSYDYSLYTGANDPPPNAYSGDGLWATVPHGDYTNAGGSSFLSKTIDLSGVTDAELSFYEWHDVFGNFDWIAVNVNGVQEWLYDLSTPSTSWQLVTIYLDDYTGSVEIVFELYASTAVEKAGWYIDNVTIIDVETEFVPEYDEEVCTIILEPGEEADLIFPDWTPDTLALGVSGSIAYTVMTEQHLAIDTNSANDILSKGITLDYWHDVGVKEITSPAIGGKQPTWIQYSDETPENALGLTTAPNTITEAIKLTPDELGTYTNHEITQIRVCKGYPDYTFEHDYEVWIYTGAQPTDPDDGTIVATGTSPLANGWFEIDTDDYAFDPTDTVWVGVNWDHHTTDTFPISMDNSIVIPGKTSWWNYNLGSGWAGFAEYAEYAMMIGVGVEEGGGPPGADVYIALGSQSFAATMENIGVFPETGLDANAKLFAFNETGVPYEIYEANYTDFDLDPLGGEELATFGSYNFVDSGIYELKIFLPLAGDDYPNNNLERLGIGVDDTPPTSDHTVDPGTPDGDNGWFVSDVTVSFTADDGTEPWQSGVDHIEYRVDGGSVQTGDSVTLHNDGEYDVEYRAVDNVGNEEAWNPVPTIKIDQTAPEIDLQWESPDNENVIFTATCSDPTSGMNRVEFFIGIEYQFTAPAAPFEWTIEWSSALEKVTFYAYAYDDAGNSAFDKIKGEDIKTVPQPHSQSQSSSNLIPVQRISLISLGGLTGIQNTQR